MEPPLLPNRTGGFPASGSPVGVVGRRSNGADSGLAHGTFVNELMNAENKFPEELLLNEPERRAG